MQGFPYLIIYALTFELVIPRRVGESRKGALDPRSKYCGDDTFHIIIATRDPMITPFP
jgi:hypothetical protein